MLRTTSEVRMGIRVNDFLRSSVGRQIAILAGESGLDNDIQGVTIIEVPDIVRYIDGGEALMTGLYAFQTSSIDEFRTYFQQLKTKNVSALFLKKRTNIAGFEEKMKYLFEFCNQNAIPLLEVPMDIPFPKVMNFIMEQLVDEEVTMMKYFRTTHENFFAITLKNASDDTSIREIHGMLEQLIGNPVSVFNDHRKVIVSGADENASMVIRQNARTFDPGVFSKQTYMRQTVAGYEQYIIKVNYTSIDYLYLVIDEVNAPLMKMDFMAIENAALALQIEYSRLRTMNEIEKKYQKDLIESLLLNKIDSQDELRKCLNTLKLKQSSNYRLYAWTMATEGESISLSDKLKCVDLMERQLRDEFRDSIIYRENDRVIVIEMVLDELPQKEFLDKIRRKAESVRKEAAQRIPEALVLSGVSKVGIGAQSISKAYQEALDALKYQEFFADEYMRSPVMLYSELGVFRYLYKSEDREVLKEYIPETLQQLFQYKATQRDDLIKTLKVYLNNNQNLSKTAQELFVHYKTASYRIDKIIRITGIDFEDPNEVLSVRIGLIVQKIIENLERRRTE